MIPPNTPKYLDAKASFESAVRKFQGQLGAEAKSIPRSRIASRSEDIDAGVMYTV